MLKIILALLAVVIVGGFIFLSVWNIPAPQHPVEKTIPYEQLQK